MALYKDFAAKVVEMKNNGHKNSSIGDVLGISDRTVRRALKYYQEEVIDVRLQTRVEEGDYDGFPQEKVDYSFILTPTFLTISKISGDKILTETIENADDRFNGVVQGLMESGANQVALKEAFEEISAREQLMKLSMGRVEIDPINGTVSYSGRPIASRLEARIVEAARSEDGDKLHGLVNFTERLHQNPSEDSVDQLFGFLEHNDIEIDQDGMVVAFKRIRDNWKDCYSNSVDNSIGAEPWMPRWEVNNDKHQTCSYGYHVCAKSYLGCFWGDRVIRVLVDPADFVSIPVDYNNAKARVCRYKVIEEITDTI